MSKAAKGSTDNQLDMKMRPLSETENGGGAWSEEEEVV